MNHCNIKVRIEDGSYKKRCCSSTVWILGREIKLAPSSSVSHLRATQKTDWALTTMLLDSKSDNRNSKCFHRDQEEALQWTLALGKLTVLEGSFN